MSPQYLSPGVYVEEVDRGPRPIQGVGTSVAAFVGYTKTGPIQQATLITNWTQFVNTFGDFVPGGYLPNAVYGYFLNGGGTCYVVRLPETEPGAGASPAPRAVLPAKADPAMESLVITALDPAEGRGISVEVRGPGEGEPEDQFTLLVRCGTTEETFGNLTTRRGRGLRNVVETVNKESRMIKIEDKEGGRSTADKAPAPGNYALVTPETRAVATRSISPTAVVGEAPSRTGIGGLEAVDEITMVCVPDLMSLYQAGKLDLEGVKAVQLAVLSHCELMKDRFAVLDCPPGFSPQQMLEWRQNVAGYDSKYGAIYYPWIKVANPLGNGAGIMIPPSGHMAGVYARTDTERGVHKAPANEIVRGALSLEVQITKGEQDLLNPVGINCIRTFPGRGIRIWGARTLSSDAAWRYINVRRLFNFIEESIEQGTQWVVFEPNDMELWSLIRRDITSFLTRVWRDGALFGATPKEAFYVRCDGELNTPDIRDAGQVIIEIGLAPVKPAEFVIFRISQFSGSGDVAE
ncbi:MAG: phage tail sheath family protein [Dehalococcoidia bacterium]|nr:phage tail sheath family protein [Dehalococcoidia bacterium]